MQNIFERIVDARCEALKKGEIPTEIDMSHSDYIELGRWASERSLLIDQRVLGMEIFIK